jgi:hypothetical protein
MILVTKEFLEKYGTKGRAWTNAQFISLGIDPKNNHKWKSKIIGTYITQDQADAFIKYSNVGLNDEEKKNNRVFFKSDYVAPKRKWLQLYAKLIIKGDKFFEEVVKDLEDIIEDKK